MAVQQMMLNTAVDGAVGQLTDVTISRGTLAPAAALAHYTVYAFSAFTGQVNKNIDASASPNVLPETWLLSGVPSDYDVRFTLLSSSPGSPIVGGTFDQWLNISSDRSVSISANSTNNTGINVTYNAVILVEFSLAGQATTIGSVTVTLQAARSA